jgi:hypothetical protein
MGDGLSHIQSLTEHGNMLSSDRNILLETIQIHVYNIESYREIRFLFLLLCWAKSSKSTEKYKMKNQASFSFLWLHLCNRYISYALVQPTQQLSQRREQGIQKMHHDMSYKQLIFPKMIHNNRFIVKAKNIKLLDYINGTSTSDINITCICK